MKDKLMKKDVSITRTSTLCNYDLTFQGKVHLWNITTFL